MTEETPIHDPSGQDETAAKRAKKRTRKEAPLWRIVIEALVIMALVHTLLFRPFFIPSGSMKPNLLIGDYIIINKFSYGYSRYSCYFALCPIKGRIFGTGPERGDVAVFAHPTDGRTFVKRTVGMPGDRIRVENGVLYINDEPAPQQPMEPFIEPLTDYKGERGCIEKDSENCYLEQFSETLPNGYEHSILNQSENGMADNTPEWTIPEGHYFMMGDNRDNSNDSRGTVGLVPAENFIGKAKLIVFSSSGSSLFKFWRWRSDRFFTWVD